MYVLDMRMSDPYPTFAYLVVRVRQLYPRFAYLHIVEPRVAGIADREALEGESNDFLRAIWNVPGSRENGSVYVTAGAYTRQLAIQAAEEKDDLVAFGRHFIANVRISSFPMHFENEYLWLLYISPTSQLVFPRTYHSRLITAIHSTPRVLKVTMTMDLRTRMPRTITNILSFRIRKKTLVKLTHRMERKCTVYSMY